MPAKDFNALWLKTVELPKSGRIEYFDEAVTGLGLRVSFTGKKTWFLFFRPPGEKNMDRITLGTYPVIPLADARDKAKELLLRAKRGEDLTGKKKAERTAPTFKELVNEYLERHASKNRTEREQRRILEKDVVPAWGDMKAKDVSRADVIALVEEINDRGAPIMANRTLNLIGRVFRWGIKRGLLESNPASMVEPPGEEQERDRVLNEDEICRVWKALDGDAGQVGPLLKLALLTGQRRGEIEKMRWADIEGDWWTIPKAPAKNKQAHRVPLSSPALAVLQDLRASQAKKSDSTWVFTSRVGKGQQPINNIQKRVDAIREASGIDFNVHDLRRTVATQLGALGIPRFIIGKVLNHTELSEAGLARVTSIYDRHSYDEDKRSALHAWADRLSAIIDSDTPSLKALELPDNV